MNTTMEAVNAQIAAAHNDVINFLHAKLDALLTFAMTADNDTVLYWPAAALCVGIGTNGPFATGAMTAYGFKRRGAAAAYAARIIRNGNGEIAKPVDRAYAVGLEIKQVRALLDTLQA